jgi:hypothetical protein
MRPKNPSVLVPANVAWTGEGATGRFRELVVPATIALPDEPIALAFTSSGADAVPPEPR